MSRLIGINGLKRSGKDTTARIIAEESKGVVIRRAFADKLKIIAAKALGFERSDEDLIALMDSFKETALFSVLYDEPSLRQPVEGDAFLHQLTGRQYLQWFGEHCRTVFGDTFWIDQVLPDPYGPDFPLRTQLDRWTAESLTRMHGQFDTLTVTDVRYPNEAERVLNLGGEVWEIARPGIESDGHSTETPLPPELVTVSISNDAALDSLRAVVKGLLKC